MSEQTDAAETASDLEAQVIAALRTVYDPEIPVNVYDLGLIYGLDVDAQTGQVVVQMTLTNAFCPVAQSFPNEIELAIHQVPGVKNIEVQMVWEPPWTQERMSDAARLQLGLL